MARHIWTILCSKASIDQQTNNISIFDVIERLTIAGAPHDATIALPIQANLVVLWMRSEYTTPEAAVGRFTLVAPNRTTLGGGQFEINLGDPHIRARNIMRMNSLPLQGPGVYNFVIELQDPENNTWSVVATLPLEVIYGEIE